MCRSSRSTRAATSRSSRAVVSALGPFPVNASFLSDAILKKATHTHTHTCVEVRILRILTMYICVQHI